MKNVKIEWDFEKSQITVEMVFPYVSLRSNPPHNLGHPISSSIVVGNAVKEYLKGTSIKYSYSFSVPFTILTLKLDLKSGKSMSLDSFNSLISRVYCQITADLHLLINTEYKYSYDIPNDVQQHPDTNIVRIKDDIPKGLWYSNCSDLQYEVRKHDASAKVIVIENLGEIDIDKVWIVATGAYAGHPILDEHVLFEK